MALYDPHRQPSVDPADAIVIVHAFLERCRRWAVDQEIPKRLRKVEETHDPADAARLHEWITWERFVEHAMTELRDGRLDDWFDAGPLADETGSGRYSRGREKETR
jgi:hypothetical protein